MENVLSQVAGRVDQLERQEEAVKNRIAEMEDALASAAAVPEDEPPLRHRHHRVAADGEPAAAITTVKQSSASPSSEDVATALTPPPGGISGALNSKSAQEVEPPSVCEDCGITAHTVRDLGVCQKCFLAALRD